MNLSYSSLSLLHTCPRLWELEKLLTPDGVNPASLDLIAGSALGNGLQALLAGKSLEVAAWHAYKAWTFPEASRSISIFEASKKKSFSMVLNHLEKYSKTLPFMQDGWQLWVLPNGRAATEVGFRLKLPTGDYYRGWIDAILSRTDERGELELCALEIKSSGFREPNPAMFQNSFQGFSYGAVVDAISHRRNDLQTFFVCTFPEIEQLCLNFYRTPKDKLSWLPALGLDIQAIAGYKEQNHFPMRGESCFNYFRPCKALGICNLARTGKYIEQPEDTRHYDFEWTLEELVKVLVELE